MLLGTTLTNIPHVAFGYKTQTTDGHEWYKWVYKAKYVPTDEEYITMDDGTDSSGQQLIFKSVQTEHKFTYKLNGKSTTKAMKDLTIDTTGQEDEDYIKNFFESVSTPDAISPVA